MMRTPMPRSQSMYVRRGDVTTGAVTTSAGSGLLGLRRWQLPAAEHSAEDQPADGQDHEEVAQILAVAAIRPVRFRGPVPPLGEIGREDAGFGELVEAVDQELH